MAGRTRTPAPVVIPSNTLVASAVRYPGKVARIYHPHQPWQIEAYRHYRICGEARFSANFFGHSLSRCTIHAAQRVDGKKERVPQSETQALLDELFGGIDGQPEMLKSIGIHLTIGGEFYLVGRKATGSLERDRGVRKGKDLWEVVGPLEMSKNGEKWAIKYGDGLPDLALEDDAVVIRVWRPDPISRIEADSPFRSLLPVLSEIEHLTMHIFSQVRSRLTGAGILFLPSNMEFPPPPEVDGEPVEFANNAEQIMATIAESILTPVENDGSPAAVVPTVITTEAEAIDKARLMTFWSELDEKALEMRNAAVHRFAVGMDCPPEQILGMSSNGGTGGGNSNGVSHWGQWQIDEQTTKLHIEPMLQLLCNAITVGYSRPLLADDSTEFADFDTQHLRLRPDRSKEAMLLWQEGVLSTEAMLRENGFDEDDLAKPEEQNLRLLRQIAGGSATPDMVLAALTKIGLDLGIEATDETLREAPPSRSLEDVPTRDLPEREESEAVSAQNLLLETMQAARISGLVASCDALVFRGLERVGNRLRQNVGKPPNCRAWETHTLVKANGSTDAVMKDAFGAADFVLGSEAERIIPILDAYTRTLLAEQSPHSKERMVTWLKQAEVL